MPEKKKRKKKTEVVGLFGVGLDNRDGEYRLTRSEHFLLVGGSHATHERMQETAIRFEAGLKKQGRPLSETPSEIIIDMLRKAQE